ncbi:hypothetical protein Afe04nite_27340 [Asanoa ferruginea]|nr:hypothetical protein Afe04nite_27340 [Asanoa ferruginea]
MAVSAAVGDGLALGSIGIPASYTAGPDDLICRGGGVSLSSRPQPQPVTVHLTIGVVVTEAHVSEAEVNVRTGFAVACLSWQ